MVFELKKELKSIGYNVSLKSKSYGRHLTYSCHATYVHIESKDTLPYNEFIADLQEKWKPLQKWQAGNRDRLAGVRKMESIYGLSNLI